MTVLQRLAEKLPTAARIYRQIRSLVGGASGRSESSTISVFHEIYRGNVWGSPISASGSGSVLEQTAVVREALPQICAELAVNRLLDVPCGDFHWMQHTGLEGISYVGADIVDEIVALNALRYGVSTADREFLTIDLCADPLPCVDLILCRDCIVHLSVADAGRALRNICRSGSQYLLTTTFTNIARNTDIVTGSWRPLNLCLPPFSFPGPIRVINEGCTEGAGGYSDKSLGLWRIADISGAVRLLTA